MHEECIINVMFYILKYTYTITYLDENQPIRPAASKIKKARYTRDSHDP